MPTGRGDQVWTPGNIAVLDFMVRPGGPAISLQALAVYLCLFSYWGPNGDVFPSVNTIAEGVHAHRATVIRALKELEDAGLIRRTSAKGKSNSYVLVPPWAEHVKLTSRTQLPVAQSNQPNQSHTATSSPERQDQSLTATTTSCTERHEETHVRNPPKKPNDSLTEEEAKTDPAAPASSPEAALWQNVLSDIEADLRGSMDGYLAKTVAQAGTLADGRLVVSVPGTFARDRTESRYGAIIRRKVALRAGREIFVEFQAAPVPLPA